MYAAAAKLGMYMMETGIMIIAGDVSFLNLASVQFLRVSPTIWYDDESEVLRRKKCEKRPI